MKAPLSNGFYRWKYKQLLTMLTIGLQQYSLERLDQASMHGRQKAREIATKEVVTCTTCVRVSS